MSAAVTLPDSIKAATDVYVGTAYILTMGRMTPAHVEQKLSIAENRDVTVRCIIEHAQSAFGLPACFTPTQACGDAIVAFFISEYHDLYNTPLDDVDEAVDRSLLNAPLVA